MAGSNGVRRGAPDRSPSRPRALRWLSSSTPRRCPGRTPGQRRDAPARPGRSRRPTAERARGLPVHALRRHDCVPTRLHDPDTARSPSACGSPPTSTAPSPASGSTRGRNNTGTHTGTLWSRAATALADGHVHQRVDHRLADADVRPARADPRDTEYIASYVAPMGRYSATLGAFFRPPTCLVPLCAWPAIRAPTPTPVGSPARSGSNYLVDVMFERLPAAIDIAAQDPAPGALDVPRNQFGGGVVLGADQAGPPARGDCQRDCDRRDDDPGACCASPSPSRRPHRCLATRWSTCP